MKLDGVWPQANNNPTIGIEVNYQIQPEVDTTVAMMVWNGHVQTECHPPPPPWTPAVRRSTPSNITISEMQTLLSEGAHRATNINVRSDGGISTPLAWAQ
eukprot:2143654-Karenia_brevis.AAC.1